VARRVTTPTSRGQGLHQRKGGRAANDAHRDAPRAASSGEEGGGGARRPQRRSRPSVSTKKRRHTLKTREPSAT
jgi:hypothetical protein